MTVSAQDIANAAVEAAVRQLKSQGLEQEVRHLPRLFAQATSAYGSTKHVTLETPTGNAGDALPRIAAALEKALGGNVHVEERANPKLLGGAVLLIGDKRIDLSVRGELEDFAQSLATPS